MKQKIMSMCLLLLSLAVNSQTWYLVRHAEKVEDGSKDPALTSQGHQRAIHLAAMLSRANIDAIYSTDYQRTRQTAVPLANYLGLEVTLYDPSKLTELAAQLKSSQNNALVVGHSNTTPMLLHLLSGHPSERLDEVDYDNVYQVTGQGDTFAVNHFKSWPSDATVPTTPFQPVLARFFEGQLHFDMLFKGDIVGQSTHHFKQLDDVISLQETTTIETFDVAATIKAEVLSHDLSPLNMSVQGQMGGPVDIDLKWHEQQVVGHSQMTRQAYQYQGRLNINQPFPENTFERTSAIMLAHLVPVSPEFPIRINWFNGYDGEQKSIDITHEGTAQITVPAGTFETNVIKYSGGAPSQLFYIDQKLHKVVKIEVLKSPWEYHLRHFE